MKKSGQYEKGDKFKRGNCDVIVEENETDEEFDTREAVEAAEKKAAKEAE